MKTAIDNAGLPPASPEAHQKAVVKNQKFKIGDVVTYTNDYGVRWPGKTITGIEFWDEEIRYFYAPSDAPWFSVREKSLKLED
jgi:hypothetical protein